jgi:hypothetical protein
VNCYRGAAASAAQAATAITEAHLCVNTVYQLRPAASYLLLRQCYAHTVLAAALLCAALARCCWSISPCCRGNQYITFQLCTVDSPVHNRRWSALRS